MASGLVALLDDVIGIAKIAAASIDDVGVAAGKAGVKAAGVVVDDTAVTPRYVTGFTPDRELPIIGRIAFGSLRNKLLFLLPAALVLSTYASWAIMPLLMLGGSYLCYEGAEKVWEALTGHAHDGEAPQELAQSSKDLEREKVSGAIRTDFILSAEIMAIALADVADQGFWARAIILAIVAVVITIGVYGLVAIIVKMDDIGLYLARAGGAARRALGRFLVQAMPKVLAALSVVGIAAMIWVGGGIVVHGLEHFHIDQPGHAIAEAAHRAAKTMPAIGGLAGWLTGALGSGVFGLMLGAAIIALSYPVKRVRAKALQA